MEEQDAICLRSYTERGDEQAFRVLVERHLRLVWGVAWRRTRDRSLAEEICQNVFAALAQRARAGLAIERSLTGWLYRVAVHQSIQALRKERVRQRHMKRYAEEIRPADAPQSAPALVEWLEELLGKVGDLDREILLLRHGEGRSFDEIALAVGKTNAACQSRHARALTKLQALLRRRGVATPAVALGAGLSSAFTESAQASVSSAQVATRALALAKTGGVVAVGTTLAWLKPLAAGGVAVAIVALFADIKPVEEAQAQQGWQKKWEFPSSGAAAVAADGTVYLGGDDGAFHALDPDTKKVRWRVAPPNEGTRVGWAYPAVGRDGSVFAWKFESAEQSTTISLHSFDGATGRMRWEFEAGDDGFELTPPAIAHDGTAYFLATEDRVHCLFAVDGQTGGELWRVESGSNFIADGLRGPVIAADGTIFAGRWEPLGLGSIRAHDPRTGRVKWTSEKRADFGGQMILGEDGTIFVGSAALDWATGKIKWARDFGARNARLALTPDGTLFISCPGWIRAVDSKTGADRWKTDLQDESILGIGAPIVLADDGSLYVLTSRGLSSLRASDGVAQDVMAHRLRPPAVSYVDLTLTADRSLYAQLFGARFMAMQTPAGAPAKGWPTLGRTARRDHSAQRSGPPVILSTTPDQPLLAGTSARLAVLAGGDSPLTYQWLRNGAPIEGATGSSFDAEKFHQAGMDVYRVKVSNAAGSVESAEIKVGPGYQLLVDVVGTGSVSLNPPGGLYFPGTKVELTATNPSLFRGWTGYVSSTETAVSIQMDTAKRVVARFGDGPGAKKWSFPLASTHPTHQLQVSPDGTVYTAESVSDGGPIFTSLLAIDGKSGLEKWRKELPDFVSSPNLARNGYVLVGTLGAFLALDPRTGAEKWSFGRGRDEFRGFNEGMPASLSGGGVIMAGSNLYSIHPETGEEIWRSLWRGGSTSFAVGEGDIIFRAGGNAVLALRGKDGSQAWEFLGPAVQFLTSYSSPAVSSDGSRVFVVTRGRETSVQALNAKTGEAGWTYETGKLLGLDFILTVSSDDTIYFSDGTALVALDGKTGIAKWRRPLDGTFRSAVIDGDGNVIVGLSSGVVLAVEPSAGKTAWTFTNGDGQSIANVAIGPDGTVYALAANAVHALQGSSTKPPQWPSESGGQNFRRAAKP